MNRILTIIFLLCTLGGCGIRTSFETPRHGDLREVCGTPETLPYGDGRVSPETLSQEDQRENQREGYATLAAPDTVSMDELHWRAFFRDERLRALIDTALRNNADMRIAMLGVRIAQASLRASKLAFFPSLGFTPSAAYSDGRYTVALPVEAAWEIDIFGRLRNAKKRNQAALTQTGEYVRAVRSQLIAAVATAYYSLVSLDVQREIYRETEESWKRNVEVTRHLMEAGRFNSASLSQAEASYCDVLNNLIDIEREIRAVENTLCGLLGQTPRTVERGSAEEWQSPAIVSKGVPMRALSARPDVREAEMALAQAFYAANEARAAFYPTVTITGSYDFREMLYGVAASLFQPLFQRGALRAGLDAAKAAESQAAIAFRQAVVDAGIEVNDALAGVRSAQAKQKNYTEQIGHLENAVNSTRLLMNLGSTTYLEVLTAQQTLLTARIGKAVNDLSEITAAITLYRALGGGGE